MNKNLVSIWMITYNHENYISQAIEGILMQQTNFDYELVIGEDKSTDKTREICEKYATKFPDKIKLLPSDKHYGAFENQNRTLYECTGKYVAMCEGDDYWTDPYKLQKQINFLEKNPEYSFCYHKVKQVNADGISINNQKETDEIVILSSKEVFENIIPTLSVVMRNNIGNILFEFKSVPHGDALIFAILASKGKCAQLGFLGGCYRMHLNGIYSGLSLTNRYLNTILTRRIMLRSNFFPPEIKKLIKVQIRNKKKKYLKKLLLRGNFLGFSKVLFS